jgi:hypothetical protein
VSEEVVRWPRVKEILANIMGRWERREGRKGLPGVHGYYWETPQELANDTSMGLKFIQPGIPASNTALIISLRKGLGSIPKMPMNGPFLKEEEIQEIELWIDSGMPE